MAAKKDTNKSKTASTSEKDVAEPVEKKETPTPLPKPEPKAYIGKGEARMTRQERDKDLVVDERVLPDSGLPTEGVVGILDIATEGSGLLRPKFTHSESDIYISASQIRRFNLRVGDLVGGQARRPKENERYWGLLKVETVNGVDAGKLKDRSNFDELLAIYPDSQIHLSTTKDILTTRVIDLVAPIGFGEM